MTARLHRLGNGLTIIVDPMAGAQSAAVGLYAGVGSRSEPEGKGGLAHMVEHMVFKGAGGRSARQIAECIEDVGGQLNAWTARDQTVFHARTLGPDVPLALDLLADLVRAPAFDPDELEREKGVILSELGEILDNPEDLVGDRLLEAAFAGQAFGRPVIGTADTIRAFTRVDLVDWTARQWIAPQLLLVACGAVEEDMVLRLAEQRFADLPSVDAPALQPATFTGGHKIDRRRFVQAHWSFALPAPAAASPAMPAVSVFAQAAGGGMSSRLFQEVREQRGLAYSIFSWVQGFADTGVFVVGAATDRNDAPAALQLSRDILADAAETLTDAEVARAKAQIEAGLRMTLEGVQGRADQHARSFEIFGRLVSVDEMLGELRAVDAAGARAAGAGLLAGPRALASIGAGQLALAA
jgi:predicted Zn-dependent peptidase